MATAPPGFQVIPTSDSREIKDIPGPVFCSDRLWNVTATHSGKGEFYYVTNGTVWHSVNRSGPFHYLGRKGDLNVQNHEKYIGSKLL